jgi:tRNA (cytidine/uridine-2'-O-)-methyltransferase
MLNIALYQPEIPPNTGNIIRLAANTGCILHLIHPLAFNLSDQQVRRAGLDYRDLAQVREHASYSDFLKAVAGQRLLACTTKAQNGYSDFKFSQEDILLFGPETSGLPRDILESLPAEQLLRIPMLPESRSLNLSNAVAVIVYEAWRQLRFIGAI